ncbi:hypothetical protein JCM12141A_64230 [Mycolicibacterium hodleri]
MYHRNITCCTDTGRAPQHVAFPVIGPGRGRCPGAPSGCARTTTFDGSPGDRFDCHSGRARTGPGHLVSDPDASITDTNSAITYATRKLP